MLWAWPERWRSRAARPKLAAQQPNRKTDMTEDKPSPEPEPVDAEFEPADETPAGPARSGPGAAALTLALIAALSGGLIGFVAARVFPAPAAPDTALATQLADQTTLLEGLETRLAALESEDPAAAMQGGLSALSSRIDELETRPAGEDGTPVDLSPLEDRIAALEAAPAPESGDTQALAGLTARIEALEGQDEILSAQMQQAIAAGANSGESAGPAGVAPEALIALEARLGARLETLEAAPVASDPGDRLAALESGLEAITARVDAAANAAEEAGSAARAASAEAARTTRDDAAGQAARTLAARALALTALKEIAAGEQAFEAERAALARLWRGREELAVLARYSRAGTPTPGGLAASYPAADIRAAAGQGRYFFGLVEIRPVEAGEEASGATQLAALAESRLAADDLEGAVVITERLEGEALETVRPWLLQARARLDTDRALDGLSEALTEAAAAEGADPT